MTNNTCELICPKKVWSCEEVFSTPCQIKKQSGVYAWYFKEIPPGIKADRCMQFNDLYLLYIGISPRKPPKNKIFAGHQNVYMRIRFHFNGNAEGSTLRLSLGCLLSDQLQIELRRTGKGKCMTFLKKGEAKLSDWMSKNAFVTWVYQDDPWILEEELVQKLYLPLNLQKNKHNENCSVVKESRSKARSQARELPIVQPSD